jgi:hypothetical protein
MFPMSKKMCTLAVAAVTLTTASLATSGDALALDLGGILGNRTKPLLQKPGGGVVDNKGPLTNTNKIGGGVGGKGIDKVLDVGGKVIDKTMDVGGKVIDKAVDVRGKVIEQNLAAQRPVQRPVEKCFSGPNSKFCYPSQEAAAAAWAAERRCPASQYYDSKTGGCRYVGYDGKPQKRDPLAVRQALEAQAEAARAEAARAEAEARARAAEAEARARAKVIYVHSPAPVAPAPLTAVAAPAPTCLTKEYLQAGTVLFKDVCSKEWAMNSTTVASQVVSEASRACLTKENLQGGVVLFKDACTNEWAMNPPEQQAQAPQAPQVR